MLGFVAHHFNRFEPKIALFWTRAFVAASLGVMVLAGLLLWQSFREYAEYLPQSLTRETVALAVPVGTLAWLILPSLCAGVSEGAITAMLKTRHLRVACWLAVLVGVDGIAPRGTQWIAYVENL